MTINKIQMFAQTGCLGGFTHALPDGRVCYYAEADLIGARGVKLWMQASPMAGEQMPSDAAYKVFNDTRRMIEAGAGLLAALEELQANPNDPRAHRVALDAIRQAKGRAQQ